jgi:hypothetical protein
MVTCAFDVSGFEVTVVFGVPISLEICTLSNVPFEFGQFEFYLYYSRLVSGLQRTLVLYCLILKMFVTVCPDVLISVVVSSEFME